MGDERARRHILRGLSSWRHSVRAQSVAAARLARLEAAINRRDAKASEDQNEISDLCTSVLGG
jgi:hypothetical protein